MQQQGKFILCSNVTEFAQWLNQKAITRQIQLLQVHHTASPSYKDFSGSNHFSLLEGMENYHIHFDHFSQIAQNFTTFPDGSIAVCRDVNTAPAIEYDPAKELKGIYGANAAGICVENLGTFDTGGDQMADLHRDTIVRLYALLCRVCKLVPTTDAIVYHHWYDLDTGQRTNGTGVTKTCPGTNWFGGNTVQAAQDNFIPLISATMSQIGDKA
ncbi:MAG TPA: N-acetylmuramoyl-L-alanine amidase [Firmicutes bacterium]|jgi:hypothetical protein|nr:N-acetylmuramoyl-L-alanine amidase [Bacillota bacterium]